MKFGTATTMARFKLWMSVAFGAALLVTPLWIVLLMQMHVSFLSAKMAQLQRQMREGEVYSREFSAAFAQSSIDLAVRRYYTYSSSEVAKLNRLRQEDGELAEYIRTKLLISPPKKPNKQPMTDTSKGHAEKILTYFKNMTGGFFIECGAMDGTFLSNTLLLEAKYNWTGLLIEAEPNNFRGLLEKKRNVWALPACLSLKRSPSMVSFASNGAWAKISDKGVQVHCMPLFSILQAINRTSIDFFSLDIEGNELDVLRLLPFDKVDIKTFAIEHSNIKEGREHLLEFMLQQGYYEHPSTPEERTNDRWAQEDYIFIKK